MRPMIPVLLIAAMLGCSKPPTPPETPPLGGGPPEVTLLRPPSDCPILTPYRIGRPGLIVGTADGYIELPEGGGIALPLLPKPGYEALESAGYLLPCDWLNPPPEVSD